MLVSVYNLIKLILITCILYIHVIEIIKNPTLYMFVNLKCVDVFISLLSRIASLKKRWLKHPDSNRQTFNYESGILPLEPNLLRNIVSFKISALAIILQNGGL